MHCIKYIMKPMEYDVRHPVFSHDKMVTTRVLNDCKIAVEGTFVFELLGQELVFTIIPTALEGSISISIGHLFASRHCIILV